VSFFFLLVLALALVMWTEITLAFQHLYSEALVAFRMNVDLLAWLGAVVGRGSF
jgi:hypothetical protein